MKFASYLFLAILVVAPAARSKAAEKTAPPERAEALVTLVEGSALVFAKGTPDGRPLKRDDMLGAGQEVRVGKKSRVEFRLPDGTIMRFSEKSRLEITHMQYDPQQQVIDAKVRLESGRLWTTMKKSVARDAGVDVETGVSASRGRSAAYCVTVNKDGATKVKVYDGTVHVTNRPVEAANKADIVLAARKRISITSGGGAFPPKVFNPGTETDEWTRWNRVRDFDTRELAGITIRPAQGTVVKGRTRQFMAVGRLIDRSLQDLTPLAAWESSNKLVATVNSAGFAMAGRLTGTVDLIASFAGKQSTARLIVNKAPLTFIRVSPVDAAIPAGKTHQFTAAGTFSDSTVEDITSSVTWTSSDPNVATIDAAGLASAGHEAGTATITAFSGSRRGLANLSVAEPALVSIMVTPADITIQQMISQQFEATGIFEDNSSRNLTSKATWTTKVPLIAAIDANGMARGIATGSCVVSATWKDKTGSAKLNVSQRHVSRPDAGRDSAGDDRAKIFPKWPESTFVTPRDGASAAGRVVVQKYAGLMWVAEARTPGPAECGPSVTKTRQEAHAYVDCLNALHYLGYSDWRLPDKEELLGLADYKQSIPAPGVYTHGFSNVQVYYGYDFWVSNVPADTRNFVDMAFGVTYHSRGSRSCYVWPVRDAK